MKTIEYGREDRETVMLLHGGGLSWWNYRREAEEMRGRFHIVMPVLDGHADSGEDFVSIEENAGRIIDFIDREYGGKVLAMGGLSLGAQILAEILSRRGDICRYAVIESAALIPDRVTGAFIGPAIAMSYGLIRKKRFAKAQFRYLRIRGDLFGDYYRDTCGISKENMAAFLKANAAYAMKPGIRGCRAKARIIVGEREGKRMIRSAELLHGALPGSSLEVKKGLHHGEYSINRPEEYVKDLLDMIEG